MFLKRNKLTVLVSSLSALGACSIPSLSFAQENQGSEALAQEEVIVTGFRRSLEAALDAKRMSANNTESIIAEDIGKMPDLNLAESLQRVPGVAITREGGEGRNITVRGLGPGYTRTTLNGMEVPASTGGLDSSGGVNRSRNFDFNVFGSELFKKITINKNSIAHIEEGGLASTVELFTHKPFDNPGFHANVSGAGNYNIHSGELDPKITGLISTTFDDERFGVLFALSHSDRTVHQEGFGTVRYTSPYANPRSGDYGWANSDADTVINGGPVNWQANGVDFTDITCANNAANPADCDDRSGSTLDYAWLPRLPRMDSFNREQSRTGYMGAFQFAPNDKMEFTLDIVGSQLKADVYSYNYFAQIRNLHQSISPTEVTLDNSGRLIVAGTFDNIQPRSESRGQFSDTDFLQTVLSGKFEFSDTLNLNVMAGRANSKHVEEQYRFNITAKTGHTFSYSLLEDSNIASMSYDFDILDFDAYDWSGPTLRHEEVDRTNTTFKADLTWDFASEGDLMGGFIYNEREIDSKWFDPINLTATADLPVLSAANTNRLSEVVDNYGDGIGGPSGFPNDWLVSDFGASRQAYNAGQFRFNPTNSNTYNIVEETLGAYVEVNYQFELAGKPLNTNAGIRAVETTVTSSGQSSDGQDGFIPTELERSYTNVLPAINTSWEVRDDLLLRASASRNMARPGLGSMAATVNVTPINGNVAVGNPGLEPEIADAIDLSVEWYFADESVLAFGYFTKDIEGGSETVTLEGVALDADVRAVVAARPEYNPNSPLYEPSALNPASSDWDISTPVNKDAKGEVDGYELSYQQALEFGVGFLANYTYVDSTSVTGLSKKSYNLGVYYENELFGGRIMVNGRDDYITDDSGSNGNKEEATTGPTRVDFSSHYNVTEDIKLTLEIINLTNEKERLYTTGPTGDLNLVREYNTTGTEMLFGVRASF